MVRTIEVKYGRTGNNITHIDMSNKEFIFPNKHHQFHDYEGITKELIIKVLKRNLSFKKSPTRFRHTKASNNYYVTDLVQRFPCIRITVMFKLLPNNKIQITNAFLGSVNAKNRFEKEWRRYWKK